MAHDAARSAAPRLVERWPTFARELRDALRKEGERELAAQVDRLTVVQRCRCAMRLCQSFYTAPPPTGAYGPGHRNVVLDPPWPGDLTLDVVGDRIMQVEVLGRPPLD